MANKQKQFILLILALVGVLATVLLFGGSGVVTLLIPLMRVPSPPVSGGPGSAAKASSPKPNLPEGMIAVAGKHVVLHALPPKRERATALVTLGDAALEKYAHDLGAALPREPIAVYLLDTMEDLQHIYTIDAISHHPGFAYGGSAFIYYAPRSGDTIDADSEIAHILDHELCHALHQRLFPNYEFQPSWLKEGLANAWTERALSGHDALTADHSLWTSTRVMTLRMAVQQGDRLAVTQILQQPDSAYDDADRVQQNLTYYRCFALVRMLDDPAPANAARHAQFQAFLKEADTLKGKDIEAQINACFLERFGGAHLADLQTELNHRIMTEKVFPLEHRRH